MPKIQARGGMPVIFNDGVRFKEILPLIASRDRMALSEHGKAGYHSAHKRLNNKRNREDYS
jgi:hypothetical protein